jgi:hypothetical protein
LLLYIFWKGPKQATSRGCNICDVCAGRTNKIIFCSLAQSACLNASTCTSSGGHDNINLSQQSDTLAKSPSSFLNDKLNKMCAVKCESSHKPVRNCSSKITSGHAITESLVQQKLVNHFSNGSSSSKGKSTKKSVKRVNNITLCVVQ